VSHQQPKFLAPGAPPEMRREWRYPVYVGGELRLEGKTHQAEVVQLSSSGALVHLECPPPVGANAELWIEDFGAIEVKVIHSSERLCGLALLRGAPGLDEFLKWAQEHL
jgi:hypothetical protein